MRQLREFAALQGWTVYREFIDHETAKTDDREQFQLMFNDASQRKFDVLLFWALDRLSREGVLETLQHLNRLTSCGVAWRSFSEQYLDSTGVFKDAVIGILAVIAKQERIRLSERTNGQSGFSLLEMLFATIILLVGLVAIAQLVPASIYLNYENRLDSSATVLAQAELDQFLDQPLTLTAFLDRSGNACSLGDPTQPNVPVGSTFTNGFIDFNQLPVAGYNLLLQPDPNGPTYELRWAVITISNGSIAYSKRFILRVRQQGGNTYFPPVTLDAMISK